MDEAGDVSIGIPTMSDLEALVELWSQLVTSQRVYGSDLDPAINREAARRHLMGLLVEEGIRVAVVTDAFVGFTTFSLQRDAFERSEQVGIIENLYVEPAYRGLGIGTRLLDHAEKALEARGATLARLEVLPANTAAQSFYRDRGYRPERLRFEKPVETDTSNSEGP